MMGRRRYQTILLGLSLFLAAQNQAHASSLFDEVFANRVPYPIERAFRHLNQYFSSGASTTPQINTLLIPSGRSIQAGSTNYAHPRIIIGVKRNTPSISDRARYFSYRFFMGYSENARELEAISWDEAEGRFAFQRVSHYGEFIDGHRSGSSTANISRRCLRCHQNEGPILSLSPWREMNDSFSVSTAITDSSISPLAQRMINAQQARSYHGVALENGGSSVDYDILVRAANRLTQARHACKTMCENNVECHGLILRAAIESRRRSFFISSDDENTDQNTIRTEDPFENPTTHSLPARAYRRLQQLLETHWPVHEYAYRSSVLADRDPLRPEGHNIFLDPILNQPYSDWTAGLVATVTTTMAPPGSDLGFPETPRPLQGRIPRSQAARYASDVAFECLGFTPDDKNYLDDCTDAQRRAILNSAEAQEIMHLWPLAYNGAVDGPNIKDRVISAADRLCTHASRGTASVKKPIGGNRGAQKY